MKRLRSFMLALLLPVLLILPALAAGDAVIGVTVPSEHTVEVVCGSGGKVTVGGTDYTGTNSFAAARHGDFTLTALPDSGYELVSVTGDSVCQMSFEGNGATLRRVTGDTVITVLFRAVEAAEDPVLILVPVTSQNNSIAAEAVITGASASIALDETDFEEFLENDNDPGNVTVDISHLGVSIDTVDLPTDTLRSIAAKVDTVSGNPPGMSIILPESTVTLDSAALTAIADQAGNSDISLHVEKISPEKLNTEQQSAIDSMSDDEIVVTVTMKSGDTTISDFKGGSVDIELPYEPRGNEDTDTITVWFVSEDGSLEQIPCRYNNGVVAFTVSHFSEYLIIPGTVTDGGNHCFVCGLIGHNIAPWCRLIPILVIVTVTVIAAAVLIGKNRKKSC